MTYHAESIGQTVAQLLTLVFILIKIGDMKTGADQDHEWDTNLGWWTEKPEKPTRRLRPSPRPATTSRPSSIWRDALLTIGLMFALVLSLISLALR
ncbi:hypothetical protein [Variovorax sp. ZT4R33]|uniref:hypothetical protein n=1 Tax=Variovorax sp. ZT4R33 TaxID=3443743 RepID=UPI003F45908B